MRFAIAAKMALAGRFSKLFSAQAAYADLQYRLLE
jgi:hypothetical protein